MENTSDIFEEAIKNISLLLGIHSTRPDKQRIKCIKGDPDNLWAFDNLEFFVIQCKNDVEVDTEVISKTDCAQLISSMKWFDNLYQASRAKGTPIMIHRVNVLHDEASPIKI